MTDQPKSYKTAGAFRAALEARLQTRAREQGTDLQRLRRQVAFDRFLARMFSQGPKAAYPWVLKGGYAMELRMHSARTTKDIDLTLHDGTRLSKNPKERAEQVRAMLQEAAASPFDDYFEFLVGEARQDLDGAPEGGNRYPIQARMDGRDFARFHVDVGVGDEVIEPLDLVTGEDWLSFGGVAPPSFPIISAEQQFAEKLHAYTLPRGERVNTLAMHGRISTSLAGSTTVLTSLASAAVNLPIVWRATKNRAVMRRVTLETATVIGVGILAVAIDRIFQLSELLVRR